MRHATFILDPATGGVSLEGLDIADAEAFLAELGHAEVFNCARPLERQIVPIADDPLGTIAVHRVYRGACAEGPGVRSVIQVQGCPIRCVGCYVPETHPMGAGVRLTTENALTALLGPSMTALRDGVSIVGGEPTAQADALLPLARTLNDLNVHLVIYTGYTVPGLIRAGRADALALLACADLVVDGPYIRSQADGAGEWRGSRNQMLRSREDMAALLAGGRAT